MFLSPLQHTVAKGSMTDYLTCMQLAFNVVAHFLLGSRLASSDVKEALREDFYTLTEGLFAMPVNFPTTKFSKALKVQII